MASAYMFTRIESVPTLCRPLSQDFRRQQSYRNTPCAYNGYKVYNDNGGQITTAEHLCKYRASIL